jgi:hypothetical protein
VKKREGRKRLAGMLQGGEAQEGSREDGEERVREEERRAKG